MPISNETIIAVAQAVQANTDLISKLIDSFSRVDRAKVGDALMDPKTQVVHVTAAPTPVQAPIAQVGQFAAPVVVTQAPVTTPLVPGMPAPPTFVTPVTAPVQAGVPFTDAKGLLDYVMGSYKAMGAAKGAGIQGVLSGLGLANINDVKPEQYAALYAGVESLKG